MLAGKIRKSIYVKDMLLRKIAALHLFQQQGFLIARVAFSLCTYRIIGFQDQCQLMELLGKDESLTRIREAIRKLQG